MRLAVSPTSPGLTASQRVELCVAAEADGYREAWLAEVAGPEAFSLAGAIAARTAEMELGVAVVAASTRTPALLAMGAATVSQLAGGRRFALGIGSSSRVIVERWHGRDFTRPLLQVREAVEATRAALAGERDYDGETASFSSFSLESRPAGPVPIYVAALGPGMLALAGEVADGVCLNLMPPDMVSRQLDEIRNGAERAGRTLPPGFGIVARLHVVVDDDVQAARSVVRAAFGPYFAQPVYNRFLRWCGFPEAADRIARAWAERDRRGLAEGLSDEVVDAVALAGPLKRIEQRLGDYAAAGIEVAALNVVSTDPAAVRSVLGALAE